jgi:hypothetical protein
MEQPTSPGARRSPAISPRHVKPETLPSSSSSTTVTSASVPSSTRCSRQRESGSSALLGGRPERIPMPKHSFVLPAPKVSTDFSFSTSATSAQCSRPMLITTTERDHTEESACRLPRGHRRRSNPSPPSQPILDEGIGLADSSTSTIGKPRSRSSTVALAPV